MEIITAMTGVCELLDEGHDDKPYSDSLAIQAEKIRDPDRTPSARMLAEMRARDEGFFHFALRMSQQHQAYFRGLPRDAAREAEFVRLAEQSWEQQHQMEAANNEPFSAYLQRYFSQPV